MKGDRKEQRLPNRQLHTECIAAAQASTLYAKRGRAGLETAAPASHMIFIYMVQGHTTV